MFWATFAHIRYAKLGQPVVGIWEMSGDSHSKIQCSVTQCHTPTDDDRDDAGKQFIKWIVTGATCETGNAHSFRNTWFHDFTHSLVYALLNLSVLELCLRLNDSGLFSWISLTALSWTYFIITISSAFSLREPRTNQWAYLNKLKRRPRHIHNIIYPLETPKYQIGTLETWSTEYMLSYYWNNKIK